MTESTIQKISQLTLKYSCIKSGAKVINKTSEELLNDFLLLAEYSKELILEKSTPKRHPHDVLQMARLRLENEGLKEQLKHTPEVSIQETHKIYYQKPETKYENNMLQGKCQELSHQVQELENEVLSLNQKIAHLDEINRNLIKIKEDRQLENSKIHDLSQSMSLHEEDSLNNLESRESHENQIISLNSCKDTSYVYENAIKCVQETISILDIIRVEDFNFMIMLDETTNSIKFCEFSTLNHSSKIQETKEEVKVDQYSNLENSVTSYESEESLNEAMKSEKLIDNLQGSDEDSSETSNENTIKDYFDDFTGNMNGNYLSDSPQTGLCILHSLTVDNFTFLFLYQDATDELKVTEFESLGTEREVISLEKLVDKRRSLLSTRSTYETMHPFISRHLSLPSFNPRISVSYGENVSIRSQGYPSIYKAQTDFYNNLRSGFVSLRASKLNLNTEHLESLSVGTHRAFKELDVFYADHVSVNARKEETKFDTPKKSRASRKTAIEEYFTLTVQAIKLNMKDRDKLPHVSPEDLFKEVQRESIPFNFWHRWVTDRLNFLLVRK